MSYMADPWAPTPSQPYPTGPLPIYPTGPPPPPYPPGALPAYPPPVGFAPPPPDRPRRTGLIVAVVAGAVVVIIALVTAGALIVVNAGHGAKSPSRAVAAPAPPASTQPTASPGSTGPLSGAVTIEGPNGSTFHLTLPTGFTVTKDSDPLHGTLSASSEADSPPYLDIYTDSRTGAATGDVDRVAKSVQADDADHGVKVSGPPQDRSVNRLHVALWHETRAATSGNDAETALIAVVLVGGKGEYVEVDYSEASNIFSAPAALATMDAVMRSLRPEAN